MKKYLKSITAAEKVSQDVVDKFANECVDEFAKHGFEMRIVRATGEYHGMSVGLQVESVDGDSSIVYRGDPVYGGYAMSTETWWNPGYERECNDRVKQSIEYYVDRWLGKFEELKEVSAEMDEAEAEIPEIVDEFLDRYGNQFPGLELNARLWIYMTGNVNGPFEYPLLRGGRDDNPAIIFEGVANGKPFKELYTYADWKSGKAEDKFVQLLSKMYSRKQRSDNNAGIVAILKDHGIDTTKGQYQLVAESYERFDRGRNYTKKFTSPGDYLAYFSMVVHASPNYNNITDYFGDLDEFEDFVEEYPTVRAIADHAASSWWGDGDDYIISLKNLSTGEVLYEGDNEGYDEYEEDDDWD